MKPPKAVPLAVLRLLARWAIERAERIKAQGGAK